MAAPPSNPDLTPAMKPPDGVEPNFTNPHSSGWVTIVVVSLVIALSTPMVALRMYARKIISNKLWWDDWCCVVGWAFMVALGALLIKSLDYGGAVDQWNVSQTTYAQFQKIFHDIEIVARIGMFFTKASIILFYHRLFVPAESPRTAIFWPIWFIFWWNLLYAVALVVTVATECVGKADIVARGGECVDEYAVLICASVINVVSDLVILIIPITVIWNLQMSMEKKVRLSALFAVGTLGVAASVARLGYQIPESRKPNQTIIVIILSLINITEQAIGVAVACMPTMPAFFRHVFKGAKVQTQEPRGIRSSTTGGDFRHGLRGKQGESYLLHSEYQELNDIEGQRITHSSGAAAGTLSNSR